MSKELSFLFVGIFFLLVMDAEGCYRKNKKPTTNDQQAQQEAAGWVAVDTSEESSDSKSSEDSDGSTDVDASDSDVQDGAGVDSPKPQMFDEMHSGVLESYLGKGLRGRNDNDGEDDNSDDDDGGDAPAADQAGNFRGLRGFRGFRGFQGGNRGGTGQNGRGRGRKKNEESSSEEEEDDNDDDDGEEEDDADDDAEVDFDAVDRVLGDRTPTEESEGSFPGFNGRVPLGRVPLDRAPGASDRSRGNGRGDNGRGGRRRDGTGDTDEGDDEDDVFPERASDVPGSRGRGSRRPGGDSDATPTPWNRGNGRGSRREGTGDADDGDAFPGFNIPLNRPFGVPGSRWRGRNDNRDENDEDVPTQPPSDIFPINLPIEDFVPEDIFPGAFPPYGRGRGRRPNRRGRGKKRGRKDSSEEDGDEDDSIGRGNKVRIQMITLKWYSTISMRNVHVQSQHS